MLPPHFNRVTGRRIDQQAHLRARNGHGSSRNSRRPAFGPDSLSPLAVQRAIGLISASGLIQAMGFERCQSSWYAAIVACPVIEVSGDPR